MVFGLGILHAEPAPLRDMAKLFLPEITAQPDCPEALIGHRISGVTCWYFGDYAEAHEHYRKSIQPYDPAREESTWDLQKVWDLMGSHRVPRLVDRRGKLSLYNRPYSMGVVWASRTVWVGFDPVEGADQFFSCSFIKQALRSRPAI